MTPAFLGDARQAHRNLHRSGRGEMAPAAAPGGRGQRAYAGAESELGAEGARRKGGAAAAALRGASRRLGDPGRLARGSSA